MGDPDAPEERARVHWSVPPPPPGAGSAAAAPQLGEEFLFHLYRGSELLKEDHVYEAKGELERALSLQPKDVEGQSLLGIVYFRLGHYPRAIQIYEELIRVRPDEIAPRVNLALCHLKTGQLREARAQLEEIVQNRPDHARAWGYLGLVHQRLGDFEKASIAFERAGRPHLAARVRSAAAPSAETSPATDSGGVEEIGQDHASAAPSVPPPAEPAQDAPPPSQHRPSMRVVTPGTRVRVPVPLGQAAREALLVFPERPRVVVHEEGPVLVRVDRAFHARTDAVRASLPDPAASFRWTVLRRRGRGPVGDEPVGGVATPFGTLEGSGRLVLGAPEPFVPFASSLDGEPFYVREERLLGFDGGLEHEAGRMAVAEGEYSNVLHLSGVGFVVLAVRGPMHGIEVLPERPVRVRTARLLGWVGRLLARPVPPEEAPAALRDTIGLSGSGIVLMDGG
jgi:Flp pilus assembly protein TadD